MEFFAIDALCLLLASACIIHILDRDMRHESWHRRYPTGLMAFATFYQGLWLLGIPLPGANGYPWPRLVIDGCLAVVCALRAFGGMKWREALKAPEKKPDHAKHERLHIVRRS